MKDHLKANFGGNVRSLLFELDTDRKVRRAKAQLAEQIVNFEPRVTNVR